MTATSKIEDRLDARGLNCPLPVLKAQKRLKSMLPGALLEVLATDPKAPADFEHFSEVSSHKLLSVEPMNDHTRFVLQRKD